MKMKRTIQLFLMTALVLHAIVAQAAIKTEGNFVTIDIENAQAGAARCSPALLIHTLVVMNSWLRGMPHYLMAAPTPSSFL